MRCFNFKTLIILTAISLYFFESKTDSSRLAQLTSNLNSLSNYSEVLKKAQPEAAEMTWNEWYERCNKLPFFRDTGIILSAYMDESQMKNLSKAIEWDELEKTIYKFIQVNTEIYSKPEDWIENAPKFVKDKPNESDPFFTNFDKPLEPMKPFVQKLIVKRDIKIGFHGDFHGDIHSMIEYIQSLNKKYKYMEGFKITDPNFYLVFLGDYEDRGIYGAEVWYTLMRLKIANPEKVLIIRGNHENYQQCRWDGFGNEFMAKFGDDSGDTTTESGEVQYEADDATKMKNFKKITRIFDFLPVALFLGSGTDELINYLLCVHGGLSVHQINYDTFISQFNSKRLLSSRPSIAYEWIIPIEAATDFMWSDFMIDPKSKSMGPSQRGAGYNITKLGTQNILEQQIDTGYALKGIFRAHQHATAPNRDPKIEEYSLMQKMIQGGGVAKLWPDDENKDKNLWDNIVCTFLVGPDSPYGKNHKYDWDGFGILTTAKEFKDWKLIMDQNHVYIPKT